MDVLPVEMDYCEDADLAATNSVKNAVGKVPRDCVADIAVKNPILLRVRLERRHCEGVDETLTLSSRFASSRRLGAVRSNSEILIQAPSRVLPALGVR